MKLSKEGQIKLNDFLYAYGAYAAGLRSTAPDPLEFEPSDFKNSIVLTLEEAKNIETCLYYSYDCINGSHFPHMHSELRFFLGQLRTKIKQAEGKHGT